MKGLNNSDFLAGMLEACPARIALVDRGLNFVYLTKTEKEVADRVIGTPVLNQIPPEYWDVVRTAYARLFNGEGEQSFEVWVQPQEAPICYRTTISPYVIDGEIQYAVLLFSDVTQEVIQERLVQEKEAQISAIINNTSDLILSIDRNLNIIEFNEAMAEKFRFGFGRELKSGEPVFNTLYQPDIPKLKAIYDRVFQGERVIVVDTFPSKSGKDFYFETSYHPIIGENEVTGIALFSRDITSLKEGEVRIANALHEKETLLSEIHHRVKNNLAAISSIIQLHALNSDHPETLELLNSAQTRLKTTALVHEMLYENESLSHIEFREYIHRLCHEIDNSYRKPGKNVQLTVIAEPAWVNIHQAIPCGLILNEMMTNAFKHAFRDKEYGAIFVEFKKVGEMVRLSVSDDGGHLPDTFDPTEFNSTGMILVQTLTQQLEGRLTFKSKPFTEFMVEFELEK